MDVIPTVSLKTDYEIPKVGLGTWDLSEEEAKSSVETALDLGYTHIDTAEGYRNESGVGDAIQNYDRSELFITSKVLPSNLHYDDVLESCEASLDRLGTDYLDLYLIHWPNEAISIRETMHAMKKLEDSGKVKNVGVSNFGVYQLKIARKVSDVPITVNQIEFHPWFNRRDIVDYCKNNDIVVTAAAPLARTQVLEDDLIGKLAEKYDKTQAQVVIRWEVQKDIVSIPKSTSRDHIRENLDVFDWEMEREDLEKIDRIEKRQRCYEIDLEDEIYGIPS